MVEMIVATIAFAVWLYLIAARGRFWLSAERDGSGPAPVAWPDVIAVIPARNEAEGVGDTVGSLLRQDYAGPLSVVLVDDQSTDGTADVARRAAALDESRLTVLAGEPLPAGWTGKLWAMQQGFKEANNRAPKYLLFTDADTRWEPGALGALVEEAERRGLVLMVDHTFLYHPAVRTIKALVAAGDRQGNIGIGYGKAKEGPLAIQKGTEEAKKALTFHLAETLEDVLKLALVPD